MSREPRLERVYGLSGRLLDRLDLGSAVESEARRFWRATVPSRTVQDAVAKRPEEATEYLRGLLEKGLPLEGQDEIQSLKPGHGIRPLTLLTFPQQVLYEALVRSLEPRLPAPDESRWEKMQSEPLSEEVAAQYIVHGDVAAFYYYIDHDMVESELVAQTGEAATARAVSNFLGTVMGRRFGLPQLYPGSDLLSEVLIDRVERSLIRTGHMVWRYRDDFRIAAQDWVHARDSIEALERELRSVGLTLNEEKTFPQTRDHFAQWLSGPTDIWRGITDRVEADLRAFDPYAMADTDDEQDQDEDLDEEQLKVTWVEAARRAVELWTLQEDGSRLEKAINRQVLKRALWIVTHYGEPVVVEEAGTIASWEPQLTPWVGLYLRSVAHEVPDAVESALMPWTERARYSAPWQRLWLLEPAIAGIPMSKTISEWVIRQTREGLPDAIRARAALASAMQGILRGEELAALYSDLRPASRPDVVAAMALTLPQSDSLLRSVRDEGPFNRWIVEDWLA